MNSIDLQTKIDGLKKAIAELEDAIEKSALVTPERIIANLAGIAFDEKGNKTDRIRASELLGKNKKLWTDRVIDSSDQQTELDVATKAVRDRMVELYRADRDKPRLHTG